MKTAGPQMGAMLVPLTTPAHRQVPDDEKGPALHFTETDWIHTLKRTLQDGRAGAQALRGHGQARSAEEVGLFVDEWGAWYDVEPGTNPGFLFQQNTMRDAVVAGLNLNIFQKHADRVRMANIAQMINVLQAMVLTDKEKMLLTPTYHVFEMYQPFQSATLSAGGADDSGLQARRTRRYPAVSVSAARGATARWCCRWSIPIPNSPHASRRRSSGAGAKKMSARVLTTPRP